MVTSAEGIVTIMDIENNSTLPMIMKMMERRQREGSTLMTV
jgi:hypothetical protein